MIQFIKGLFYDLSAKVSKMEAALNGPNIHPEMDADFLAKTVHALASVKMHILSIIASGELDLETLAPNNIFRYNTLSDHVIELEIFRYLIIVHYGEPEVYFKKKIHRIYDEINCLQLPPLITTISNSENYYWALPAYVVIAVPKDEEQNLLNLPDLFHEMGHLIESQYGSYLRGDIEQRVRDYFNDEIDRVDEQERGDVLKEFYGQKLAFWLEAWIMEFICDLIATYLVGPAYAWTNLKITTVSSGQDEVFEIESASHPSDESRMRAIFCMLKKLGHTEELGKIEQSWEAFKSVTNNPVPQGYNATFPQHLIERLTENVLIACQNIDLRCYRDQLAEHEAPISKMLNEAWMELFERPETFQQWEANKIDELKASFAK